MKRLVFKGVELCELETVSVPTVKAREILLETIISGVSAGTETMWFNGTASALKSGRKKYPYFPGYELVGTVANVGSEIDELVPGDRVFTMKPHATHALVDTDKDILFKLPDSLSNENALGIALGGTALNAIHRGSVTMGDKVAVLGLGVLGLILVQILSKGFGCEVIAFTSSVSKLETAIRVGALEAHHYDEIGNLSDLELAYVAFECSGTNKGLHHAQEVVGDCGNIVAAGFYTEPMELDGEKMFAKELSLLMVRAVGHTLRDNPYNRWDRFENLRLSSRLAADGTIRVADLVTHRFDPENAQEAYNLLATGSEPYGQTYFDWRSSIKN